MAAVRSLTAYKRTACPGCTRCMYKRTTYSGYTIVLLYKRTATVLLYERKEQLLYVLSGYTTVPLYERTANVPLYVRRERLLYAFSQRTREWKNGRTAYPLYVRENYERTASNLGDGNWLPPPHLMILALACLVI